MLDWISSKVAVSFAVMLMLASISACFAANNNRLRERELRIVAQEISAFIGEVMNLHSVAELRISADADSDLSLPEAVGESRYSLQLRMDSVVASQGNEVEIAHWSGGLHLWRIDDSVISKEDMASLDEEHRFLDVNPCEGFSVSTEEVDVEGVTVLLVFAYLII